MHRVERIALISDIHGNEYALRKVLKAIRAQGVDRIVCLGDVATLGVAPREVLALLMELGCPCIAGNHDDYLLGSSLDDDGHADSPMLRDAIIWCREELSSQEREFVRSFRGTFELTLGGQHRLSLFHGSPSSNVVNLLPDTPAAELDTLLGPQRTTIMAGGHTHLQMLRQHGGALVVNPGSVGAAFREYPVAGPPRILAQAEYAMLEARGADVSVTLHRLALNHKVLARAAAASRNPWASALLRAYR
jgi:putative phosphoesterase